MLTWGIADELDKELDLVLKKEGLVYNITPGFMTVGIDDADYNYVQDILRTVSVKEVISELNKTSEYASVSNILKFYKKSFKEVGYPLTGQQLLILESSIADVLNNAWKTIC